MAQLDPFAQAAAVVGDMVLEAYPDLVSLDSACPSSDLSSDELLARLDANPDDNRVHGDPACVTRLAFRLVFEAHFVSTAKDDPQGLAKQARLLLHAAQLAARTPIDLQPLLRSVLGLPAAASTLVC